MVIQAATRDEYPRRSVYSLPDINMEYPSYLMNIPILKS